MRTFVGRTLDLKSAYKQLPCSRDSLWASVIALWNPENNTADFFVSDVLMFGSTASVYGFNRCARAIWHIAVSWAKLLVTQFYDDYPSLEVEALEASAYAIFTALLKALGWKVSQSKDEPFSKLFSLLGVQVDLSELSTGTLTVSNKDSRIKEIVLTVDEVLEQNEISSSSAASLFGRLTFALSSCFGKGAAPAVRFLNYCTELRGIHKLTGQDRTSLTLMKDFMLNIKPRKLCLDHQDPPIFVFTDAAFENGRATFGIFVIDKDIRWTAGGDIEDIIVDSWMADGSKQVISQAELYPVLLVKHHSGSSWIGRKIVYYIDNDSSRFSLIKASSQNRYSVQIVKAFYATEIGSPTLPWFARVPSSSNVADLPSRGKVEECALDYAAKVVSIIDSQRELRVVLGLDS